MRRLLFILLVLTVTGGPLAAATLAGVTLPDTYMVAGQPLALNGVGLRTLTFLQIRIYVAGLYLAQPSHDAGQILGSTGSKVVLLKFLHAGTKEQIEREYRAGERLNCGDGGCAAADEPEFERLVAAAPAVQPGDTSTFIFTGQGATVLANDRVIATITTKDLASRLLAGFIGAHPPTQELRRHLLGLPG